MALFSRNTKATKKADAPKKETKAAALGRSPMGEAASLPAMKNTYAHVLTNPRITEKATFASANSVYVFDVAPSANKKQIVTAIEATYKVKPSKIRIVNTPAKTVRNMRTGKYGMKQGGKKAYVYLAKGTTITIS
jgi:large subunit ribosomal protein L23